MNYSTLAEPSSKYPIELAIERTIVTWLLKFLQRLDVRVGGLFLSGLSWSPKSRSGQPIYLCINPYRVTPLTDPSTNAHACIGKALYV
jgi:hypothetical protein